MFITNEIDAGQMLAEHLKGRRVSPESTAAFVDLRHDRDLCPHISDQVNTMLAVYRAYGQEVHDMQSFRDDGVDVLLTYEDKDGIHRRAGIQIKSDDEFCQWEASKLPLMQILKGQIATASANAKVDDFYVILCVDAIRHRSRIRTVCSELKNFKRCHIIEPIDALGFYQMQPMELWSRTVRLLCNRDAVLRAAIDESDARAPDVAFFTITLLQQAFGGGDLRVNDARMFDIWNEWEEFAGAAAGEPDRLSEILAELLSDVLGGDVSQNYSIQIDRLPEALCALYFDLKVRSDAYDGPGSDIIGLVQLADRLTELD